MIKKRKNSFKKGFSIGEVMLSAFVLSVGLTAIVSLLTTNLGHFFNSRNQIVASGLAQEGIELLVNVRDNNLAEGVGDFDDIPAPTLGTADVEIFCIDTLIPGLEATPNLSHDIGCGGDLINDLEYDLFMYEDLNNLFYAHNRGGNPEATRFKRRIMVQNEDPLDALNKNKIITSQVSWLGGDSFPLACIPKDKCVENIIVLKTR